MNEELGRFLASRRARLKPSDFGIRPVGRRRVVGLRREEVAALAGVGVTWYTMLESGRAGNPSEAVLRSVAAVLKLSETEANFLIRLARGEDDAAQFEEVSPEVRRILKSTSLPAYVVDRRWNAWAWNEAFANLWEIGGVTSIDVVETVFFADRSRSHHGVNLESNASSMIAMVRHGLARRPNDSRYEELASRIAVDPVLSRQWALYGVIDPKDSSRVVFETPLNGVTEYQTVSTAIGMTSLTLVYLITTNERPRDATTIRTLDSGVVHVQMKIAQPAMHLTPERIAR